MDYIIFSKEISDNYYISVMDDFVGAIVDYEYYMTGKNSGLFRKAIYNMTEKETVELFNIMYADCKIDEIYEVGKKVV